MAIRKVDKTWILYSKKVPRKRLGVFRSRIAALKRERQINYFKHLKGG